MHSVLYWTMTSCQTGTIDFTYELPQCYKPWMYEASFKENQSARLNLYWFDAVTYWRINTESWLKCIETIAWYLCKHIFIFVTQILFSESIVTFQKCYTGTIIVCVNRSILYKYWCLKASDFPYMVIYVLIIL